jgi:hypothetical protein
MIKIIDGVRIELTPAQVTKIEKEKKKRDRCIYSFKRMLTVLGFKPIKDLPGSFQHKDNDWYAELLNDRVWIVGQGIKDSRSFPGGWVYWSPKEIKEEVTKRLGELNR